MVAIEEKDAGSEEEENLSKEVNEDVYLTELFVQFQSFPPGEQKFYLSQIHKLFEGTYELRAIQEPKFHVDKRGRGRPKGSMKRISHKSATSTKQDPSGFEHVIPKKTR